MGLEDRNISEDDMNEKLQKVLKIDFEASNEKIKEEREKSLKYLKNALDIK